MTKPSSPMAAGMAILLLGACTAGPTAQEELHRFTGHKAGDFFLSYGNPVAKTQAESGGVNYRWVSFEPPTVTQPAYRSFPGPNGTRFPVMETGPGISPEPDFCELEIEADRHGIIHSISILHDGAGKRSNSLCSELFG